MPGRSRRARICARAARLDGGPHGCHLAGGLPRKGTEAIPPEEYRSLYRKYRPQAPDQVLGQDHVVRGLGGAVREGRLAHAFLFSGPRGTGKTSSARILAKMVNCEKGPTAEPCGVCDQCKRIENGSHLDVWEIDAASHGSVDNARELRERAPTAPAEGREKVYIIDEAQRLSREAFDALLKLLEEPPPGVRFVLATTEPHKMPATIVGRCQKFEFRRVPSDVITAHLGKVAVAENIELDSDAAEAIARQSDGAVRDALSLLEQASVLGGGRIGVEEVSQLIGTPDLDIHFSLADAVAVGDAREVFGIVNGLVEAGHDLRHATTQVTSHFRNLLLALSAPEDSEIVDVPPEVHSRLVGQSGKFSAAELNRILSLLLQAQTDMRWTTSPRLTLELALVRAALPETDPQPAGLISRIERLERLSGLGSSAPPAGEASVPASGSPVADDTEAPETSAADERRPHAGTEAPSEARPSRKSKKTPESPAADSSSGTSEPVVVPEAAPKPVVSPGAVDAEMLRRSWRDVLEQLKARRHMQLHATAELATVGSFDGTTLELVLPPGKGFAARKVEEKSPQLVAVLEELFGIRPQVTCTVRQGMALEPEPEEAPASPEAAEELLKAQFGAEVVEEQQ
ncbi:MAG: DNA polymerase III subunit gamma/tau [Actinomycetota bacterium]